MRPYGIVHSTFWTSETTHRMSDDARLLALYLLTGPHTSALGCFRMPDGYVMEDLNWTTERVKEGFKELLAKGFANRCETTKWVFINAYLRFNKPENPNQVKSLRKLAAQVPTNASVLDALKEAVKAVLGDAEQLEMFGQSASENGTVPKPFRNQEQEQEQKIEHKALEPKGSSASASADPLICNLPLRSGQYPITKSMVQGYQKLYPKVDVVANLRKMVGWLNANEKRRKTKSGIKRFINHWLATEHDRKPSSGHGANKDLKGNRPSNTDGSIKL